MAAGSLVPLIEAGLPVDVVAAYEETVTTGLFAWQAACLRLPGVLQGERNVVFSAPTSGGKTLVAELIVLSRLLAARHSRRRRAKAIFVLPFVAVARQKMLQLQTAYRGSGVRVEGFMGALSGGASESWDVAVCTIEKASGLVNRFIEDDQLEQIAAVVVDELHSVADASRGYLLELLISKLLFLSRNPFLYSLIGMSATVPNVRLLASWMDAEFYESTYRPVPLKEMVGVDGQLLGVPDGQPIRRLRADFCFAGDNDHVIGFALETVIGGDGVLIFCSSRLWCQKLAELIARQFANILRDKQNAHHSKLADVIRLDRCSDFVTEFSHAATSTDAVLSRALRVGVCFHHAGLTMDEREQLEGAFASGCVRVVVATSTLSSGVNLPARRVVVRAPWSGGPRAACLSPTVYRQMTGRAGRKGMDSQGESILICKPAELARGLKLAAAPLPPVRSALSLTPADGGITLPATLRRALLEATCARFVRTVDEACEFLRCTLLAAERRDNEFEKGLPASVRRCVCALQEAQFLEGGGDVPTEPFAPTQLGVAALGSAFGPDDSLAVFDDLRTASRNLVLENELHMVYLVTPMFLVGQWGEQFDWRAFYDQWCRLARHLRRVGEAIGVSEQYLVLRSQRRAASKSTSDQRQRTVHMRFYTAMILYDLVNEMSLSDAAAKYACSRGFLQSLQQQSSSYAGMVVSFCDRLGWHYMRSLLADFAERLAFGVRRELTELVRVDGLDGRRARSFHALGLGTLAAVAQSPVERLCAVLRKAVAFRSDAVDARRCWLNGHAHMLDTEAAALIQLRARQLLRANLRQLGLSDSDAVAFTSSPAEQSHPNTQPSMHTPSSSAVQTHVQEVVSEQNDCQAVQQQPSMAVAEDAIENLSLDISALSLTPKSHSISHRRAAVIEERQPTDSFSDSAILRAIENIERDAKAQRDESGVDLLADSLSDSAILKAVELLENPAPRHACVAATTGSVAEVVVSPVLFSQDVGLFGGRDDDSDGVDVLPPSPPSFHLTCVHSTKRARKSSVASPALTPMRRDPKRSRLRNSIGAARCSPLRPALTSQWPDLDGRTPLSLIQEAADLCAAQQEAICLSISMEDQKCSVGDRTSIVLSLCGSASGFTLKFESTDAEEETWRTTVCGIVSELCQSNSLSSLDASEALRAMGGIFGDAAVDDCASLGCVRTAAWCLDADAADLSLEQLFGRHLPDCAAPPASCPAALLDTWRTRELMLGLRRQLHVENMGGAYEMALRVVPANVMMERRGMRLDMAAARAVRASLQSRLSQLEANARRLAGCPNFNLASSAEVSRVLFCKLRLPPCMGDGQQSAVLTKLNRHYSTNRSVLERLSGLHPLPRVVLEWRQLHNALVVTLLPIIRRARPNADGQYRVCGRFCPLSATGRVLMSAPNLQVVPKEFCLLSQPSAQGVVNLRRNFIPSSGGIFLAADYSQLELRILAQLSGDCKLLAILNERSGDVFKLIAAEWFSIEAALVSDVQRQTAKQISYGLIYGMGAVAMAEQLHISSDEAQRFIASFKARFPDVQSWIVRTVADYREKAAVTTLAGRRRCLPLAGGTAADRAQAERQAVNTRVQGTAADLFREATRRVQDALRRESVAARLVMQLHDELIVDVHSERALPHCAAVVRREMERAWPFSQQSIVRLVLKLRSGPTWGELTPFDMCE